MSLLSKLSHVNTVVFQFLALLDYVSRANGMGSLSVVRVAIFPEPIGQIPFKFQLWLPLGNTPDVFWIFEKHAFSNFSVFFFFRFSVNHVNMKVGVNQAYSRVSTTHGDITDCKLDSVVYAGVCVVSLMWTCIVWVEQSTPDNFGVPSLRFNSATGEPC